MGRNICEHPLEQDHWSTRDRAASLISSICEKYGKSYHTLQPRIAKALLRAYLDPTKPLTTQYGAIKGLSQLGSEVTRVLVVPNIKFYSENCLQLALNSTNTLKLEGANKCKDALTVNKDGTMIRVTGLILVLFVLPIQDVVLHIGREASRLALHSQDSGTGMAASAEDRTKLQEQIGVLITESLLEKDDRKMVVQGILDALD